MFYNNLKTVFLLGILSGLLLILGNVIGGTQGITWALMMALMFNGLAFFYSDKIVLKLYRAQPLDHTQYDYVYGMVADLCATMKLPTPKLWLINDPMANAFATGRSPHHASVAVTTGILKLLEHHELRGVLAHELSHIKHRDTLVTTVAAMLASAIGYLASIMRYSFFWGGHGRDSKRQNPLIMLIIATLMPFAAMLLQLALSRSREYLADEGGAHASQDPLALASALEKLENHIPLAHMAENDTTRTTTSSMFIVNPLVGNGLKTLFSTHPSMKDRIERLRQMYQKMV